MLYNETTLISKQKTAWPAEAVIFAFRQAKCSDKSSNTYV